VYEGHPSPTAPWPSHR